VRHISKWSKSTLTSAPDYPYTKEFRSLYTYFQTAIADNGGDLKRIRFVLGPAKTYLALLPGSPPLFGPETFDIKKLDKDISQTLYRDLFRELDSDKHSTKSFFGDARAAALGYKGSWWIQFPDGNARWNFGEYYPELRRHLTSGTINCRDIDVCLSYPCCLIFLTDIHSTLFSL
jgi:hypothetical protein